jgi:hypothetical protein
MIDPGVRANWRVWNRKFEGEIPYAYCDTHKPPLVTCAVGVLIDPVSASLALPWRKPADGSLASKGEILADWYRVKAIGEANPQGLVYTHYHSPTGLYLDDDAIGELVLARLDANVAILEKEYPGFDTFPPDVQCGIASMAWAMGAGFPKTWPKFSALVAARNWRACGTSPGLGEDGKPMPEPCWINAAGNAGVIPRNTANIALFLAAADAVDAVATPDTDPAPPPDSSPSS